MLKLSAHYDVFTLMAIDPGLNNTGVAIFRIQQHDGRILSIAATTLRSQHLLDSSGLDDEDYSEQVQKRISMGNSLGELLEANRPDVVVSESPFFDRRKPGSFKVLAEVLVSFADAVRRYNPSVKIAFLPPQAVKKHLGVAGQKGKEVVKAAMATVEEILQPLHTPIDELDEHGIDAVAVGYAWKRSTYITT